MATILLRVPVEAEPKVVYDALASSEGVNGWWSNHTEGPAGVGSTMKVAFPDAADDIRFRSYRGNIRRAGRVALSIGTPRVDRHNDFVRCSDRR